MNLFTIAIIAIFSATIFAAPKCKAETLPMLHARGTQIVDAFGRKVSLIGVNLGGWLVEEPWMEPFVVDPPAGSVYPKNQDDVSIWATARARFGEAGMVKIRTAFRNAWLQSGDFDRLRAAGINCVRLPFLASLLDESDGVQWLDKAIEWAGAHGVYVILDMHGAPGSQSDQEHTGRAGAPEFFKYAANVHRAVAIWTEFSEQISQQSYGRRV